MNRQQRRAAARQQGHRDSYGPGAAPPDVIQLCIEASRQQQGGNLDETIKLLRRALAIKPDFAQALNNLGVAYLAQGKRGKAAETFSELVVAMPELLDSYDDVVGIVCQIDPALGAAIDRVQAAWPALPDDKTLFGPGGLSAFAGNPLLRRMIETVPVRHIGLERLLTAARRSVLREAEDATTADGMSETALALRCALARQCFINEYVFAVTPEETDAVARIKSALAERVASAAKVAPLWLAAIGSYEPLHTLPGAASLAEKRWPDAVDDLLTMQVREPIEERDDRATIAQLTPIEDDTSLRVQAQYEENPYPRWVLPPSPRPPVAINDFLRTEFPGVAFRPLASNAPEMLIAGCGTGQHPIGLARLFRDVRVLAVDLSLASLAHARRKTAELGVNNIEYAQADILKLGNIGRDFDIVDASGVLHHMADPMQGWRALLPLVRPGGFMQISLYSELARRDVVAGRAFVAERGYQGVPGDIRRSRQDLLAQPALQRLVRIHEYFTMSECRDLLFHVQERRLTIPEIATFIADSGLEFLGFRLNPAVRSRYSAYAPGDPAMTDLARWDAFERDNPSTFLSMYQFWVQKR